MADTTDEGLRRLAQSTSLSRKDFDEIYRDVLGQRGTPLMVLQMDGVDETDVRFLALKEAQKADCLDRLLSLMIQANAFPNAGGGEAGDAGRVVLEAVIYRSLGFFMVDFMRGGMLTAARRVCRIDIASATHQSGGTGFLIGPSAVLTAWHVIKPLLDGAGIPQQNSGKNIDITFDATKPNGKDAIHCEVVHDDWLMASSRCHDLELNNGSIDFDRDAPAGFDDALDYAIIRLAKPEGLRRGYYQLDKHRFPRCLENDSPQISLFSHPYRAPMHFSTGAGKRLWPDHLRTRLFHTANSAPASSGGLILDAACEPVALHQCSVTTANGQTLNGAVPTALIAQRGLEMVHGGHDLLLMQIASTGMPIIGRDRLQERIADLIVGNKRILSITGEKRSGKSFSAEIVREYLGQANHMVAFIHAEQVSAVAPRLAHDLLASVLGRAPDEGDIPSYASSDTALPAWIREYLAPRLIDKLRSAAGDRTLWIILDDLDANPIADTPSRDLLDQLYRDVATLPFLRFVLIGLEGRVPGANPAFVTQEWLTTPTEDDLHDYLARVTDHKRLDHGPEVLRMLSRIWSQEWRRRGSRDMGVLAKIYTDMIEPSLEAQS